MRDVASPFGARRFFGEGPGRSPVVESHVVAAEARHDRLPKLGRRSPAVDLVRVALTTSVEQLVSFEGELRFEPTPERVHKARVCVRRLRSHLRAFRPLLHRGWSKRVRERLDWLDETLSAARDADVMIARIAKRIPAGEARGGTDVLAPFLARRETAYRALGEALRSLRYRNLIEALTAAARAPQVLRIAYERADRHLDAVMQPVWRRLRKEVRRAGLEPNDRELHRIRIRAREVRYAAEAVAPVGGGAARRFAKRAEDLQTLLGEQHDAVVASAALQTVFDAPRGAGLASELAAAETADAAACRKRWRRCWQRLKRSQRFW